MGTFTDRATEVADHLADLGLGAVVPTAYDELAAADEKVDEEVDRVRAGLASDVDLDALAADLVAGKIKPDTAAKRLNAPAGARVSNLVEKVRQHAVAAEDSPDYSPAALRRSCVEVVRERLKRTAEDMLATIAALPPVARDHLTQVVDGQYGRLYGPAPADQLVGLLDVVAPGGDLATVPPDQLKAVQAARRAWQWWDEADRSFDALYYLGTGQTGTTNFSGERQGAGAREADSFSPALLVLDGEDLDYTAAGLKLPYLVAAGYVETFDVLADPYGEDAAAFAERVKRVETFNAWKYAYRDSATAGVLGLLGGPSRVTRDELRRRPELDKLTQVERFREVMK